MQPSLNRTGLINQIAIQSVKTHVTRCKQAFSCTWGIGEGSKLHNETLAGKEYGRRAQIWVVLSLVSWKGPFSHQTDFGPVTLCCSTWLRFWFGSVLQGVHKNSTGTITNDMLGGGRVQKTPAWVIKTAPGWKIWFKQTTSFSQHFLWPWDRNIKEGKNSYTITSV